MVDVRADITYKNEKTPILNNAELSIRKGEFVVLCGASGCGKSTLLRCIDHLIPDFYEADMKGTVSIGGRDISGMSIGETGELAATVFQDPRSQFFTTNSTTEIAFGLENRGISHEAVKKRTEEIFREYGMEKLLDRDVFRLSSGERQMVAVLSAAAMDTPVILLDEPSANLDHAATMELAQLLKKLKAEGKTIIVNEHRLYYLRELADRYCFVREGRIERTFSPGDMEEMSAEKMREYGLRETHLERVRYGGCRPSEGGTALNVHELAFGYSKKEKILDGISFEAHAGEIIGVIGANGSGKTTLGKLMTGLYKASGGSISVNGKAQKPSELQKNAMFIMQEAEFQFFTNSVTGELLYGRELTEELKASIQHWLKRLGLYEARMRHPFSLSGGQMQKLVLLTAYLSPKQIVVLDEPTAGLDRKSLEVCCELIREMRKTKLVIIITHDTELIAECCTRCICIGAGRVRKDIVLESEGDLCEVKGYLENEVSTADNDRLDHKAVYASKTDPRIHLALMVTAMISGIVGADLVHIAVMLSVVLLFIVNGRLRKALLYGGGFAAAMLVFKLSSSAAVIFPASMVIRVIVMSAGADLAVGSDGAAGIIAALRKMHFPERFIMVCSVMLRFFPVIRNDMHLASQAMKTRSAYSNTAEKLRNLPRLFEMIVVPAMFRVMQIAEHLAASAETRGISLAVRKTSLLDLRFRRVDYAAAAFTAALFIIRFTIFRNGAIL
ncbi:ATP-binding cassette domain-containing protein [Ruminococcus sp.]|uniref:ATP-binding cassette domain-containing protein n=1 Tax=Ruminococcus sp. TaxID=41978 RepID=UPI0025E5E2FA|nr:ATP-binding cassette domain-containing protein [Ruminococcus sp.]MBQ8966503.1 ATP-binding cassette domain-containing protein [Ruminococcus sp.]